MNVSRRRRIDAPLTRSVRERRTGRVGAVTTRYFKRRWAEPRGDRFASWGHSTWFFEVGGDGLVIRQVEAYDNGRTLRYGPGHLEDEYGGIGSEPLEAIEDWSSWSISVNEFEDAWESPI